MPKSIAPTMDLNAVLGRARRDLESLPRHEWDSYLFSFCSHFVWLAGADRAARPALAHRPSQSGKHSSPGSG